MRKPTVITFRDNRVKLPVGERPRYVYNPDDNRIYIPCKTPNDCDDDGGTGGQPGPDDPNFEWIRIEAEYEEGGIEITGIATEQQPDESLTATIEVNHLTVDSQVEYRLLDNEGNVVTDWQESNVFEGLVLNNEYVVRVRDDWDYEDEKSFVTTFVFEQVFEATSEGETGDIQELTVPFTGNYRITAYGAQGGLGGSAGIGGLGAKMSGVFSLEQGDVLQILVGQEGQSNGGFLVGGGGGTFVVKKDGITVNDILLIAGGGGGYGVGSTATQQEVAHAHILSNGKNAFGTTSAGNGGIDGNGGQGASTRAGGGGGFLTDGGQGTNAGSEGKSYLNGSNGGTGLVDGGYGGGGGIDQTTGWGVCGGGGGYSGGGGAYAGSAAAEGAGGGGGSLNNGTDQDNESGVNEGHGRVEIELLEVIA